MADDRPRKLQRPACRRCVHAAGIEGFVNCWTTHDRNVCLRHQLWIGQGCPQPDDQVDISILPSTSRAHRHHRNLISRLGRRWVSNAFPDARNIFLSWITGHSADPFGDQATARSRLVGEAGRPADSQTADGILFHPQIVSLTGLLASPIWEAKTVQSGDISWLVREITYRDILVGYVPEARTDPLIEWAEQRFSTRRFIAHRGWRLYEAFCPEETVLPLPAPGTKPALRQHRVSPFLSHSVY